MANTLAKKFEAKVPDDWRRTFPGSVIIRLPDQMTGYKDTSKNPCDYVAFAYGMLYMLEVKSHKGNTFPFSCLTQYENLSSYLGYEDVRVGVILWLYEHDAVMYVPLNSIKQMKADGLKSVNIKMLDNENCKYKIVRIPSEKKRIYMDSDYSVMLTLKDGD